MKAIMKDGSEYDMRDDKIFGRQISDYAKKWHRLDYRSLMGLCRNMIPNDKVIHAADYFELENGRDYSKHADICHYYIIGKEDAQCLERCTYETVYHSPSLDMYLVGVPDYGVAWSYVLTEFELVE